MFTLMWLCTPETYWFILVTTFSSYAVIGYPIAALLLALLLRGTERPLRRWVAGGIVLALAGSVLHLTLSASAVFGEHPTGRPDLTVMTLNMRLGNGDATEAVQLARSQRIDLLVLEEVTPAEQARLDEAGISSLFGYRSGAVGLGASGTVIYSAYPLSDHVRVSARHGAHRVRVLAPRPFWLVAVHASQPLTAAPDWRSDWAVLQHTARGLSGDVLITGDFNSTLEHGPMRELLGQGFTDAARDANSGWQPTWPSGTGAYSWLPNGLGLISIDHVLTKGTFVAINTHTFIVHGTDHRALVARLTR